MLGHETSVDYHIRQASYHVCEKQTISVVMSAYHQIRPLYTTISLTEAVPPRILRSVGGYSICHTEGLHVPGKVVSHTRGSHFPGSFGTCTVSPFT